MVGWEFFVFALAALGIAFTVVLLFSFLWKLVAWLLDIR